MLVQVDKLVGGPKDPHPQIPVTSSLPGSATLYSGFSIPILTLCPGPLPSTGPECPSLGLQEEVGSKSGSAQPPLLFIPSVQGGMIQFSMYSLQRRK